MDRHNPYAPSHASLKQDDNLGRRNEARRDGKWVVMPLEASLPRRCVKCNGEADEPTKQRTLYWHPGWVYLLLFVALLIFIIVAIVTRKKAVVDPGLCREHKRARVNAIATAWVGVFVAFSLPFMFAGTEYIGPAIWACVLLLIAVIVYAMVHGRVVYAKRIDDEEVRLGGCGEAFRDSLPDY